VQKARLLWVGFSDSQDCAHSEALARIRSKSLIEFCSIVGSDDQNVNYRFIDEVIASDFDAIFARYDKTVFKPDGMIDRERYSLFADFEGETLRMMDRLHNRGPKYRFRDSYDSRRHFFLDHCSFWYEYFHARQISHIVFTAVPHQVFDFVLMKIAQKLSISIIIFSPEKAGKPRKVEEIKWVKKNKTSMNKSTFFVSDDIEDIGVWQLSARIKSVAESKLLPLIHGEFLSSQLWDFKMSDSPTIRLPKKHHAIMTVWKSFMRIPKTPSDVLGFISNSFRSYKQFSQHLRVSPNSENRKKYVLFALAYQPEESTSPRASIFVEQRLAIKALSMVIPDNWQIRVREHPDQYGRRRPRSKEFWKDIEQIPNVIREPLTVSAFDSLVNAEAIAGPSGSLCVEAWLRGIPVILFGSMFLVKAPGVFLIEKFSDLENALEAVSTGFKINPDAVISYCSWLNAHSYVGNVSHESCKDPKLKEVSVNNIEAVLSSWLSISDSKLVEAVPNF
jgi:hypothetical protein